MHSLSLLRARDRKRALKAAFFSTLPKLLLNFVINTGPCWCLTGLSMVSLIEEHGIKSGLYLRFQKFFPLYLDVCNIVHNNARLHTSHSRKRHFNYSLLMSDGTSKRIFSQNMIVFLNPDFICFLFIQMTKALTGKCSPFCCRCWLFACSVTSHQTILPTCKSEPWEKLQWN